mgnify:CR=1 FL=1
MADQKKLPPLSAAPAPPTKRRGRSKSTEPVKTVELVDKSLALRCQGYTLTDIARHIGVSPPTVAQWLAEVWESLPLRAGEAREAVLSRELEKLDLLETKYLAAAVAGSGPAIKHVLEVMDRRAKYLGLYAPTRQEHHVAMEAQFGFKSQAEIERDLRKAIEQRKADREKTANHESDEYHE